MDSMMSLNDVCEFIVDTKHKTPKFITEGYPCIRTPNIGRGYFILDGAKCVSEESYLEWTERATPKEKDLIFAREAPVGNVAIIPANLKVCHGQRTVLIRPDNMKVDAHYLMFLLLGDEIQNRILSMASGATVAHLNMSDIRALELPLLPSIENQKKIASILSTYYDLIENNNRRIAILEEMARSLYKEWFVKFRFPGHEEVKMVDLELGQIPDGWEVKYLENVIDINRGRSYKSSELVEEGGLPFLNLKNIARDGGFRRDGLKWYNGPYKPAQTACANDIIMAVTDMTQERAVIARPARVPKMGFDMFVLSMDLIKITAKLDYDNGFVYCLLRYSQFSDEVKQFANGANVLHLSPTVIEQYRAILPPMKLQTKFYKIVQRLHLLQDNLAIKNDNLKTQLEMLLPKLISGKISIHTSEE